MTQKINITPYIIPYGTATGRVKNDSYWFDTRKFLGAGLGRISTPVVAHYRMDLRRATLSYPIKYIISSKSSPLTISFNDRNDVIPHHEKFEKLAQPLKRDAELCLAYASLMYDMDEIAETLYANLMRKVLSFHDHPETQSTTRFSTLVFTKNLMAVIPDSPHCFTLSKNTTTPSFKFPILDIGSLNLSAHARIQALNTREFELNTLLSTL
jgi:hypothetical protein